ncbi:hypothetical protein [Acholeplasma laidlawii]|uniref:hypothetical protein n=1 Tax=Acholeplasma laidlawii TaxID=2148 RepID=UPI0021F6B7B6|nr:hypothetical protein [Acholeplasma laidlawii]
MRKVRVVFGLLLMSFAFTLTGCDFLSEDELGENEVRIRESASVLEGTHFEDVVEQLQVWGFTNIETEAVYDIIWGITKEGTTKSVKIGGSTTFKKGDIYDKDVSVKIIYSMKAADDPTKQKHQITWQYEDGTIIKTENVLVGTVPNYTGKTPSKESVGGKKYIFSGWTPELIAVTEAKTYTTVFIEEDDDYVITWKNHNGAVLEIDNVVKYGVIPTYNGEIPIREADDFNTYVFEKWSPEIYPADKEQIYIAEFRATPIDFTKATAKKVMQVVLTNYMAPDTLDDTGNYVDRSKFHSYSYAGSYKLTLVSEGKWTYLGNDTWYVSNMRFKGWFTSSTYYEVYAKVTYNGEYYVVTEADNGKSSNPSQHITYSFDYLYRVTQDMIDN